MTTRQHRELTRQRDERRAEIAARIRGHRETCVAVERAA